MKVFVYGSLRRGEHAHSLLREAPLLAEGCTEPRFTLLDMGDYPGLIEGGHTAVVGEVYEVDAEVLADLDRYEDAPEVYRRVELPIAGHDAFAYVLRSEYAAGHPPLDGGDWCRRGARGPKATD